MECRVVPIRVVSNCCPVYAIRGDGDGVSDWQPIEKFSGAVTGPDDFVERDDFGEFQLDPASAGLAGNPAEIIPVASVVDMGQLMDSDVGVVSG